MPTIKIRAGSTRSQELLEAARDGRLDVLRKQAAAEAETNHDDNDDDDAEQQHDDDLRNVVCSSGCTALHWAAGGDRVAVVDYLILDRGWDADTPVRHGRLGRGRTPLHYACRNGCLEAVQRLIEHHRADADARSHKDGVTPLQLAVWRNQFGVARYLVDECNVDPLQTNDYGCTTLHWLAISPHECVAANCPLVMTAEWLIRDCGVDPFATQKQGHSALHKAAWQGHLGLVRYLHHHHGAYDDTPDHAGNYAADLCRMQMALLRQPQQPGQQQQSGQPRRHAAVLDYLLQHASRERAASCAVLDLSPNRSCDGQAVRRAYLRQVRQVHPDNNSNSNSNNNVTMAASGAAANTTKDDDDATGIITGPTPQPPRDFYAVQRAYHHLLHQGGRGTQHNPAHSLPLLLTAAAAAAAAAAETNENNTNDDDDDTQKNDSPETDDDDCFKARLLRVLMEYGDKGLDVSNFVKKWNQVWPDVPLPYSNENAANCANGKPPIKLSHWIRQRAGDVVVFRRDRKDGSSSISSNALRIHAR